MASIVERIPQTLQAIFGTDCDEVARACGFIKRERGFCGSEFVRTLVFGWLSRTRASIESLADRLGITGSALQQRLSLRCRLIAIRCPPEMAARRREKLREKARRKGRTAIQRQLLMCDWTVLITNVPEEMVSWAEAWDLYCARWQIELLFRRWKELGGLQVSTNMQRERVLCELYAKLLGLLVAHWFTLIRGGPLEGFSLTKAIRKIQDLASRLAMPCLVRSASRKSSPKSRA